MKGIEIIISTCHTNTAGIYHTNHWENKLYNFEALMRNMCYLFIFHNIDAK